MIDRDFSFEIPDWELAIEALPCGASLSAAAFLSMTESEMEEGLEDAFALLDRRNILLDVSDLPRFSASGTTAVRLRLEAELVNKNQLLQGLEENDPLRLYLEELAMIPCCGDLALFAQAHLAGDKSAAPKLMNGMLSQVVQEACALAGRGVLLLDLIQEGSLGLWQAILSYAGGDFQTHCLRVIRAALAKTLVLQAREFGTGQRLRQAMEDYRSVDERLLSDLGRNPTVEEIALELHMSLEEALNVRDMLSTVRTLGQAVPEAPEEQMPQEEDQAVEDTSYFRMRQRIAELLSCVSEQEAQLLTLRFGLEGAAPMTPEQTAARLGLDPAEVVAMEATALGKMREQM